MGVSAMHAQGHQGVSGFGANQAQGDSGAAGFGMNQVSGCQGMSGCPGLPLLHTRIVLKYIGSWVQWYYIKGNGIMSSYHYYII